MIFEFLIIFSLLLLSSKGIPFFLLNRFNRNKRYVSTDAELKAISNKEYEYYRIADEIVMTVFNIFLSIYILTYLMDFNYVFYGNLDKNIDDLNSPLIHSMKSVIVWTLCYYESLLIILIWLPTKTGDRVEMLLHHISTIILISIAWNESWIVVSVWVILLNSIFDIFLGMSRICYKFNNILQTPFFAMALFIHLGFRVILYPIRIVHTSFNSVETFDSPISKILYVATVPLWVLYIYWFVCMLRISYNRLVKGIENVDYGDTKKD